MSNQRLDGDIVNSDILRMLIVPLLREMGTPAYLVGGAVRAQMLGAQQADKRMASHPTDLDFAVPRDGRRIARQIADTLGAAFYALDDERDVGRIVLPGPHGVMSTIDVARFQGPDLITDLAGRDFTINAMAMDVMVDRSAPIDPYSGKADLQARQLRAVTDQSLRKDPVRGLRAVRLGAELGFEIEPGTQALIREAAPGLAHVSAERIRDELVKILSLPGVAHSLRQLDELGLLDHVLPEVAQLQNLEQSSPHRWDAYEHTLQTVAALEELLPLGGGLPQPEVPFPQQVCAHLARLVSGGHSRRMLLTLAALLHDLGKPRTAAVELDGRVRFIDHERVGADMAAGIMSRLRFAGEALDLVETIVRHHLRPLQLAWQGVASRRAIHRFFRDTGDSGVEIALLALADHRATVGPDALAENESRQVLATVRALCDAFFNYRQQVVSPAPLLTGQDLIHGLGLAEGPGVGRLLAALREAQATGEVGTREQAESWVKQKVSGGKLGLEDRD